MDWNYYHTFIHVADDCPVDHGVIPPPRGPSPTVALLQYTLLHDEPYRWTQEDLFFEVHCRRNGIDMAERRRNEPHLRAEFFGKPTACLRASPLVKTYGWGLHFDGDGRIALLGMEGEAYRRFRDGADPTVTVLAGMRSKRR